MGLGMLPLGLAFGALVVQSGLDRWGAVLSAALIYGGWFEFLLVDLVTAAAPLASIAVTAFLVQARHVLHAMSFPLHRVRGGLAKTYSLRADRRGRPDLDGARAVAPLAALAVTVGLHVWRRNALLSILAGTAVQVTLASTLFAR
ncbi:AzlC family ABC transporter permease [Streptomyces iakyrus]|uniref:AzlC family ABC transporter permease n=1 Tax=Streptomyces iakyrus TaxID=68219 RepID=UPI003D8A4983